MASGAPHSAGAAERFCLDAVAVVQLIEGLASAAECAGYTFVEEFRTWEQEELKRLKAHAAGAKQMTVAVPRAARAAKDAAKAEWRERRASGEGAAGRGRPGRPPKHSKVGMCNRL